MKSKIEIVDAYKTRGGDGWIYITFQRSDGVTVPCKYRIGEVLREGEGVRFGWEWTVGEGERAISASHPDWWYTTPLSPEAQCDAEMRFHAKAWHPEPRPWSFRLMINMDYWGYIGMTFEEMKEDYRRMLDEMGYDVDEDMDWHKRES